jgi:hypothetical protein
MARFAIDLQMCADQGIAREVVVNRGMIPGGRGMTILAAIAQAASMCIPIRVTGCTALRRGLEHSNGIGILVALSACQQMVSSFQRKGGPLVIESAPLKAIHPVMAIQATEAKCLVVSGHITGKMTCAAG